MVRWFYKGTGLLEYLREKNEKDVINDFLNGEQSYKYYNEFMWKDRYAECISIDKVIDMMKD